MLLKGRHEITNELSKRSRLALDRRTKEHVIVRELTLAGLQNWQLVRRLEEEAKSLTGVSHPCAPRLIDSFTLDADSGSPRFFLVQQYVSGVSLAEKQRLTQGEVRAVAKSLLEAVASLHQLSPPLLHGDLHPSRVLQKPDGALVLVGFGAASIPDYPCDPDFVAPERAHQPATIPSELYSIGAVLYWVAAREVYHGEVDAAKVPDAALRRVLASLLAPDPEARPRSAEEALRLLTGGDQKSALMVAPSSALGRTRDASLRSVGIAGVLVSMLGLVLGGATSIAFVPLLLVSLYYAVRPAPKP